ncbi:MAG: putative drug exporter of the superfamily, partial [Mycobacterium sp.]|nr:putative drug exporter of the superfamily [Mycobacterium sp.]
MSETTQAAPPVDQPLIPPFLPKWIHRLALPIVLVWLGIVFVTNTVAPQLEVVSKNHSVSQSPHDAVSFQSQMRVGKTFDEFNTDNSAMVLLEGDKPLGAEAHHYYDEIVKRLEQDKKHVQHIQDFWSDPLTAAGSQSHDQKAAYVQVYLAGNMGSGLGSESSEAVRKIVDSVPAPPG